MIKKTLLATLMTLALTGCKEPENNSIRENAIGQLEINRFDKDLFLWLEQGDSSHLSTLMDRYPDMLEIFGEGILNQEGAKRDEFLGKLRRYFTEPTLRGLYQDAIQHYDSIEGIEAALAQGFSYLSAHFPTMKIPAVYMHVSGLNQNVLAGDSLLSISIDKYLGADYPLYQDYFYEPQLQKMQEKYIVPDLLAGWLISEYPFQGNEHVLLERMIYAGKIKYIVAKALRMTNEAELMGYAPESMSWCKKHEERIWKAIIERKHLYTPNALTTASYFEDAPIAFLESKVPGNIGTWIGWRIVQRYMEESHDSLEALMRNNDAQTILTTSKYRP